MKSLSKESGTRGANAAVANPLKWSTKAEFSQGGQHTGSRVSRYAVLLSSFIFPLGGSLSRANRSSSSSQMPLVFVKFDKIRSFLVLLRAWQGYSLRRGKCNRRSLHFGRDDKFVCTLNHLVELEQSSYRRRPKRCFFIEKGSLVSLSKESGTRGTNAAVANPVKWSTKAESLGPTTGLGGMPGGEGASAATPVGGSGTPGFSSSRTRSGLGWETVFPCCSRSHAAL